MIENGAKGSDVPYKYTYCNELDWFDVNGRRARALSPSFDEKTKMGNGKKLDALRRYTHSHSAENVVHRCGKHAILWHCMRLDAFARRPKAIRKFICEHTYKESD